MKRIAKKYLIAHKDNDGKPHLLRARAVVVIAFVVAFLFLASLLQHAVITGSNFASIISSVLVDLTNGDRQVNGLHGLAINSVLEKAAELKARDMAQKSYFAHTSPEGITPWYWFREAGYGFLYAGENLAVNFSDSVDVERAWMNSPLHKKNILSENFTEIGIATAKGMYKGRETTFVVELFGSPRTPEPAKPETENPSLATVEKPSLPPIQSQVVVLGESLKNQETETKAESFVAVDSGGNDLLAIPQASAESVSSYASALDTILTAPRRILYAIYGVIALFIMLALSSFITIEVKRHHMRHIGYGVLLLGFIAGLFYISHTLIYARVFIQ